MTEWGALGGVGRLSLEIKFGTGRRVARRPHTSCLDHRPGGVRGQQPRSFTGRRRLPSAGIKTQRCPGTMVIKCVFLLCSTTLHCL